MCAFVLPFALAEAAPLLGTVGGIISSALAFQGAADVIDYGVEGIKWLTSDKSGNVGSSTEEIDRILNRARKDNFNGVARDVNNGNSSAKLVLPK